MQPCRFVMHWKALLASMSVSAQFELNICKTRGLQFSTTFAVLNAPSILAFLSSEIWFWWSIMGLEFCHLTHKLEYTWYLSIYHTKYHTHKMERFDHLSFTPKELCPRTECLCYILHWISYIFFLWKGPGSELFFSRLSLGHQYDTMLTTFMQNFCHSDSSSATPMSLLWLISKV